MKFISSRFSQKKKEPILSSGWKTKNDPAIPAVQNISDSFPALQENAGAPKLYICILLLVKRASCSTFSQKGYSK